MIKKAVTLFFSIAMLTLLGVSLSACSAPPEYKSIKKGDENLLVHEEVLKNNVEIKIYRIAEGELTEAQAKVLANSKKGEPIIAVRYMLTNKSEKPVNIKDVTIWNGNFKNSPKGVGTFNYSDISLHNELGHPTFPKEFFETNSSEWMLQPNDSAQYAYDWVIDSKDLIMQHFIVFKGDKNVYNIEVNLSKPKNS